MDAEHDPGCWPLDLAKAARDKKKADMSKRQPSSKETKAYTATAASNKALAAAAATSDSDYSTCHALYTAACLIKSSCLIRPALYLIAARKSTSFKEPAFNSPVSQALQPRPRERMPCFP